MEVAELIWQCSNCFSAAGRKHIEFFILKIAHENIAFPKASTIFPLLALIFDFCTLR